MGLEGLVSKRLESGRSALVIIEGEHCCEMDGKLPFGQSPCVILATLLSFFLPDIPIGAPLVMNSAWATTNGGPREISGHQTLDLPRRPEDKREPGGRVLEGLRAIAANRALTLSDLIGSIDANRKQGNLSSALRLFVLDHYRSQVAQANDQPSNASEGPKSLLP